MDFLNNDKERRQKQLLCKVLKPFKEVKVITRKDINPDGFQITRPGHYILGKNVTFDGKRSELAAISVCYWSVGSHS